MASVKIPEQKVILVGDFGVGKSSLFRRFMSDTFVASNDRKATLGEVLSRISRDGNLFDDSFRSRSLFKDFSCERQRHQLTAVRHWRYARKIPSIAQ